jgi:hypothetical protein
MQGKKTVGTWSVDINVKAWIDQKIANKSQFVNRILKDAMIEEIMREAKRDQEPRCPQWRIGGCGVCTVCLGEGGV